MNQLLERLKQRQGLNLNKPPLKPIQKQQIPFQKPVDQQTVIQEDDNEDIGMPDSTNFFNEEFPTAADGGSQKENINILDKSKKIKKIPKPQVKNTENGEKKKKNKKLLGQREPWNESCQILHILPPVLNQEQRSQKKYKIKFRFRDAKGKVRNYTVRFGSKKGADYVDHKNIDKRQQLALRVRNCDSVLNPNYWRIMLLNNEFSTIEEAWDNYVQTHNLYKMTI